MSEAVLAVSKHNGQVLCTCLWSKPSPERRLDRVKRSLMNSRELMFCAVN